MTGAKDEYWWRFREIWDAIGPPLRPTADAVDAYRAAAPPEGKRVLILGVTPELADLGGRTIALDDSVVMVERVWPGNLDRRHALRGDWRSMPVRDGVVEVVFGDGSLNVVRFPSDAERTVAELDRVLAPGGRAVLRVYCTPEPAETLDEVARAAHAGEVDNVFELKWRVAMARVGAGSGPSIPVEEILEAFEAAFPDRRALAESTGFPPSLIDTVDLWRGADKVLSFPTVAETLAVLEPRFEEVRVVGSGRYALAERCPLFVCDAGARTS